MRAIGGERVCLHLLHHPFPQAGMGKTLLLSTVAACHAAAKDSPEESSGLITGADLKQAYDRVCLVRLRELSRFDGSDSPFSMPDCRTIADAAASAVGYPLRLLAAIAGVTPRELSDELFGAVAPRTLWLLDGFDEAPGAEDIARALAGRDVAADATFGGLPASGVEAGKRLEAVLRVLLTQPNVVVSSRPQFEALLAPLTGRANARYLRLEPLAPEAVRGFVRQALKVRRNGASQILSHHVQRTLYAYLQDDASGLRSVEKRMAESPALLEQMRTPVLMLVRLTMGHCELEGGHRSGLCRSPRQCTATTTAKTRTPLLRVLLRPPVVRAMT